MTPAMLLVFLDSNVIFSASRSAGSPFHGFWRLRNVELLTSPYSIGEIRRNYKSADQETRGEALLAAMKVVSDRPDLPLPDGITLPDKDIPIYLAALGAGADYLITGDKNHFGAYFNRTVSGLTVMEPMPFLNWQSQ